VSDALLIALAERARAEAIAQERQEMLERYAEGTLDPESLARLENGLPTDPLLQRELELYRPFNDGEAARLMAAVQPFVQKNAPTKQAPQSRTWAWLSLAACLLGALWFMPRFLFREASHDAPRFELEVERGVRAVRGTATSTPLVIDRTVAPVFLLRPPEPIAWTPSVTIWVHATGAHTVDGWQRWPAIQETAPSGAVRVTLQDLERLPPKGSFLIHLSSGEPSQPLEQPPVAGENNRFVVEYHAQDIGRP
jgi:hypothetical protein